jgi:hypothetical protein
MTKLPQVALLAAALTGFAAGGALATECQDMIKSVDPMINRAEPDKASSDAGKCAAFGEFTGMMKMFRVISDECLPEGERRFKGLAELDRTIRNLQHEVDKKCK